MQEEVRISPKGAYKPRKTRTRRKRNRWKEGARPDLGEGRKEKH